MRTLIHQKNNRKEIRVIEEVFTESQLKFIDDYCGYELEGQSEPNTLNWDSRLIEGISGNIDITRIDPNMDDEYFDMICEQCYKCFDIKLDKNNCTILYYEGQEKSGINWHNDGSRAAAISIYLTENWDRDYGGLFSFCMNEDDGLYTSILPKRNRAVLQSGGVDHGVTQITDQAPIRRSLQIWIYELY